MANDNYQYKVLFCRLWQQHKGETYFWGGRDWAATKELAAMEVPADVLAAKLSAYFRDERWTTYGNHNFQVFVKNINKMPTAAPAQKQRQRPPETYPIRCGCGSILTANTPEWYEHSSYCQLTFNAIAVNA